MQSLSLLALVFKSDGTVSASRLEMAQKWHNFLLECGLIVINCAVSGHGQIKHVIIRALFRPIASAGIAGKLVKRAIGDVRVGFNQRLAAVAVILWSSDGDPVAVSVAGCGRMARSREVQRS